MGIMRKQGNKMVPKTHNSPKADLTDTEVVEILDQEFEELIVKSISGIKEETNKQLNKSITKMVQMSSCMN